MARAFIEDTKQYGSILGLTSIQNLMNKLNNVQEKLHIIHVAGTNGKGSTCTMIAEILNSSGKTVGHYSSPAVFSYEEIFQINGVQIAKEDFAKYAEIVKQACDKMIQEGSLHPTVFEVETAIAFVYFYEQQCDVVVLETGMGGETDATNLILQPVCSVLTSISMDHTAFLGNTLAQIAKVKAGIIKQDCPVISFSQKDEAMLQIEQMAREKHAPLSIANSKFAKQVQYHIDGMEFIYPKLGIVKMHLIGACQVENAVGAIETAFVLQKLGVAITNENILNGIKNAKWPGRFETINKSPCIIIDGAHNEDAAQKLRETIENCFTNEKITYIIGVLADKEYEKMLKIMLPYAKKVYTVTPDNSRALSGEALASEAGKYHSDVTYIPRIEDAVKMAVSGVDKGEVILAFGSLSYLSEVKKAVKTL